MSSMQSKLVSPSPRPASTISPPDRTSFSASWRVGENPAASKTTESRPLQRNSPVVRARPALGDSEPYLRPAFAPVPSGEHSLLQPQSGERQDFELPGA